MQSLEDLPSFFCQDEETATYPAGCWDAQRGKRHAVRALPSMQKVLSKYEQVLLDSGKEPLDLLHVFCNFQVTLLSSKTNVTEGLWVSQVVQHCTQRQKDSQKVLFRDKSVVRLSR